ncbi:hypothetical protein L208DRAFT_1173653, partial [Tricholoma matsutake]
VGDMEILAKSRLADGHQESWYCRCEPCTILQETGCEHPSACIKLANDLLETIPEKWNPMKLPNTANAAENQPDEWTTFSPSLVTARTIRDLFRIFTEG